MVDPIIGAQGRNFVIRLHQYFERESQNRGPLLPVARVGDRVAAALGLSQKTIFRIVKEKYGASGIKDNEHRMGSENRKRREPAVSMKNANSDDSEDDEPLSKQRKVSPHRGPTRAVINVSKKNTVSPVIQNTETDFKRHSFFAIEHSEAPTKDDAVAKTKSQKVDAVAKTKSHKVKSNMKDPLSISRAVINICVPNALSNTKHRNNKPILQGSETQSLDLNLTSDPFINTDDSLDLDSLNTLIDPESFLIRQDRTPEQLTPIKQEDQEKSNWAFNENEIHCFSIAKSKSLPKDNEDKPSSSQPKLPIAQKKILKHGSVQKSVAKADFKVGRLRVSSIVTKNKTHEPKDSIISHPVPQGSESTSETIDLDAIREHVKKYHIQNQVPTVKTLSISLQEAGLFSGSKEALLGIMGDIGFKFNRKKV